MRRLIVVAKYSKSREFEFQQDEILRETVSDGVRIISTGLNGTIVIKHDKVEFGPNCPNGAAVYEKMRVQEGEG